MEREKNRRISNVIIVSLGRHVHVDRLVGLKFMVLKEIVIMCVRI